MKRITPPFLVKTILLAFAAFLSIMLVQCKKMDISQEEISIDLPERDAPVRKFLKTNQHTRPEVRAIAQKIIRQEEEKPFLEKFVTYAGYPDWGKSITLSKSIGGSAATIGKTGSTDHSETVIIPFSFDRDSTLNAILKVTLSAEDTTFQMLYRWQYNQHGYEKNDSVNNADQTALFFMAYESFLFGHKTFRIKDTSLLKGSRSSDVIKITSFNAANTSAKMMQNSIEICFEADCPEPVQTYYAKTSSSIVIIPGICLSCFTYTYWYDDGEPLGGTNGGGSSSNNGGNNSNNGSGNIPGQDADGGGGSSSNNNNWSDDPCNTSNGGGIIHREQPVPGCNEAPAWEPVVLDDLTEPPFRWSYDRNDDNVEIIVDNYPYNKPNFQFLPTDGYETKYPVFTNLVKNLKSFVMSNRKVMSALKKWSGFSEQTIIDHLSFGEGPIIKVGGVSGSFGYFLASENPAILNIRKYYVDALEAAPLSIHKEALSFLLAVTILHEYVHLGAHANGMSEGAYDFGVNFEREAFNVVVNTDNMGKVFIDFREYFK